MNQVSFGTVIPCIGGEYKKMRVVLVKITENLHILGSFGGLRPSYNFKTKCLLGSKPKDWTPREDKTWSFSWSEAMSTSRASKRRIPWKDSKANELWSGKAILHGWTWKEEWSWYPDEWRGEERRAGNEAKTMSNKALSYVYAKQPIFVHRSGLESCPSLG